MAGGSSDESTDFDLTALMDVLSNIIFFLMASFGAAVVAMVPVSVPTVSEAGDNDTAVDKDKVTATMRLLADGSVTITAANNDMHPDELQKLKKTITPKDGQLDAGSITDHLWSIKSQFQASTDIIIVPDDDVTYELLIEAMDASRNRHLVVNGQSTYPRLFPKVVVSSLVK